MQCRAARVACDQAQAVAVAGGVEAALGTNLHAGMHIMNADSLTIFTACFSVTNAPRLGIEAEALGGFLHAAGCKLAKGMRKCYDLFLPHVHQ